MSSDASPGVITKNSGVRRVNNIPLYIVSGIMLAFLLIMMAVGMNRSDQQNSKNDDEIKEVGSTNLLAAMITGDFKEGMIESKTPPPIVPDMAQEIIIARPDNLDLPPLPPLAPGQAAPHQINPDAEHIRMMKMQQFEEAVKAKTNVAMVAPRSAASSPGHVPASGAPSRNEMLERLAAVRQQIDAQTNSDPTTAYLARLQEIRDSGLADDGRTDNSESQFPDNDISRFDETGQGDRWNLDSKPAAPATPYSLLPGFVIPAVLISGINSELPGQIMAQVSQDIYDTPIGKHRLIPQGARLVGSYSSEVAFGQSRVLVAWQRIIFPDGKTMDIGAMPGADGIGQSGFKDQVNNHYVRIFGSALLMSAVIAGAAYSQRDSGGAFGRQNAGSIMSQSLGQQLGQATTRLMMKNLNIAPTLEIRPGFRFNVIVTKDMKFNHPYQGFDY